MTQQAAVRNPFMLLLNPEVVLAAVEKSERLGKLSRHLCRPLDRAVAFTTETAASYAEISSSEPQAAVELDEGRDAP